MTEKERQRQRERIRYDVLEAELFEKHEGNRGCRGT
jgi:hypothetical protein